MVVASSGTAVAVFGADCQEHPLRRARHLIEQVLLDHSSSVRDLSRQLGVGRQFAECVIRTMALRALYSFNNSYCLEEQLRYNALYRWFVGLDDSASSEVVAVSSMTEGLMNRSAPARALLREMLLCSQWRALERHRLFTPDVALKALLPPVAEQCSGEAPPDGVIDPRLAKARDYVIAHIGRPGLGSNDLASALCISRRALYHLCAACGTTPFRLIRNVRLERCHSQICNSPNIRKIAEVAYDHGFRDYSSFSRVFKSHFGVAPSALLRRSSRTARRLGRVQFEPVGLSSAF